MTQAMADSFRGCDVRAAHLRNRGMKAWEIYSYQHPDSTALRGTVTAERRRQIIATIDRAMGWV